MLEWTFNGFNRDPIPNGYGWIQLYRSDDVWAFVLTPEQPRVIRAIVCEATGFWMWRVCCPLTMGIAASRHQAMRPPAFAISL